MKAKGMIPVGTLVGALLLAAASAGAAEPYLSAPEALAAARDGALTIIDVRSPGEWRDTGIPAGARTVTIHNPQGSEAFVLEVLEAVGGDSSRPIALICAAGGRSNRAQDLLRGHGFSSVADIGEGMKGSGHGPGWLERGLPVEPCGTC